MKNPWIVLGLSLLGTPALANITSHFYVGFAGGVDYFSADIDKQIHNVTTINNTMLASVSTLPFETNTQHFSGAGQSQIGAGFQIKSFYLGLEALVQLADDDFETVHGDFNFIGLNVNTPNSHLNFDTNLEMNNFEAAIDLKPGLFLSHNTLLYGRVGAAFNEVTLTDDSHYSFINAMIPGNTHTTETEDVTALRLGLGVEHRMHQRFTVFMDYTYTNYRDVSFDTNTLLTGNAFGQNFAFMLQTQDEANDITKQAVMLGVNYYP